MNRQISICALGVGLFLAVPARAFVRTATADGSHYLWWPTRSIGYYIQEDCALRPSPPDGNGNVTWDVLNDEVADAGESVTQYASECHDAVERSFAAWQAAGDAGCTDLQLPYLGDTAVREVGYQPDASQNINSVLFQPATCDDVIARSSSNAPSTA